MEIITGYSKLSKSEKINWLVKNSKYLDHFFEHDLQGTQFSSLEKQEKFDKFSENTIGNFHIPFGIAPNFLIDGKSYAIPMVIEESSVVAAAAKAAKFWSSRGGFKTNVSSMIKRGHIYFEWNTDFEKFKEFFENQKERLLNNTLDLNRNMEKRGGGIVDLTLDSISEKDLKFYRIELKVETCDAMGANYINSLLERISEHLSEIMPEGLKRYYSPVMAILSNSTPECVVQAKVSCPIKEVGTVDGLTSSEFVRKFKTAVDIAKLDPSRAVTHNKGIMNGVDAVVIATGNDFRAIEASCHSYAAADGQYRSLSSVTLDGDNFSFEVSLPLSLGTVGGLTKLHPLASYSLKILENPSASELMSICACVGLAQNFGALRSLITTGIQKGHMRMHLMNILTQLNASKEQELLALKYFEDEIITFSAVQKFINALNKN